MRPRKPSRRNPFTQYRIYWLGTQLQRHRTRPAQLPVAFLLFFIYYIFYIVFFIVVEIQRASGILRLLFAFIERGHYQSIHTDDQVLMALEQLG